MPVDEYGNYIPPANAMPLKLKYRIRKTKSRYSGGENPAPIRKRSKKGAKTYVYGSWIMVMGSSGKTTMVKAEDLG